MNNRFAFILAISLAYSMAVRAAEPGVTPPSSQTATNAEPTEAEMREAVQRHLDNFNAQMRPPPAPTTSSRQPTYVYSPYWGYYHYPKYSKDSDYEDWTAVAKRAAAHARVEIASFKKIRCTPEADQQGFVGEYVAELHLAGNNPAVQDIMKTSGKRLKAFFYRGDKGWICGEANSEAK